MRIAATHPVREPPAGARRDLQIPGGLLQPAPAPFGARLSLPGRVRAGLERGAATVALTITFRRALLAARFRRRRALLRHLFAGRVPRGGPGRLPGSRWSPSSPSSPRFHCLPLDFSSPLRHHGAALSRATAPTAHLSVHETVATSLTFDRILQRKLEKAGLRLSSRAAWEALEAVNLVEFEMPGRPRKAGICVNGEEGGHGNEARKVLRALGVALEAPQPPKTGTESSTETTTNLTLRRANGVPR